MRSLLEIMWQRHSCRAPFDPDRKIRERDLERIHTLGNMSLGCVMQNAWLMAESLGISTQVLSAVSDIEIADRVRRLLDIPGHMNVAFAVRLGYRGTASESHLRVRRKIEDFTHRNRYARDR